MKTLRAQLCTDRKRFVTGASLWIVLLALSPVGVDAGEPPALVAKSPAGAKIALASYEPAQAVSGSLVICGGGPTPDAVRDRFVQLAGGRDARIVVIPTASSLADTDAVQSKLDVWRDQKVTSVELLHTRNREQADDPEFVKPLVEATGVWFTGGFQWLLTDAYLGTSVEKLIHGVLKRGGVVGGTSAGAAVMSPVMIRRGFSQVEVGQGFGLLPGSVVDQHFIKRNRESRLINVLSNHPGLVGFGVDEETALVVQGRRLSVEGHSKVIACMPATAGQPARRKELKPGDEADLVAWSRAAIERLRALHPAAESGAPEVARGTLVIVGGGTTPDEAFQRFIQAAGGPDAPIVVVSTARGDDPPLEDVALGELQRAGARNLHRIHPRTRAEADTPSTIALLKQARGVWFLGGRQWRLVDAFQGSQAEKLLHEVLARDGVIGGSSAGATIQASCLVRGSPLDNEEMLSEGYERGLGFLRGTAIDQHFSQRNRFADMAALKKDYPQLTGLGVDESTALVVRGHVFEVVGQHGVAVYDRHEGDEGDLTSHTTIVAGERYDLKSRNRVDAVTMAGK